MRETIDVIDHVTGALLIGLDRKTKAVPSGKRRVAERGRYHIERQFQPVRFFGIYREIQVVGPGLPGEIDQARDQFIHHPRAAHGLEARMQCRELDRDTGPVGQRTIVGRAADRLDRACIGIEIARGVLGGAGAFAKHVEGVTPMTR